MTSDDTERKARSVRAGCDALRVGPVPCNYPQCFCGPLPSAILAGIAEHCAWCEPNEGRKA